MQCLECNNDIAQIDNTHLSACCGLTLQEYAIRHHVSLDLLIHESMVNVQDDISFYQLPALQASNRSNTIFAALAAIQAFTDSDPFLVLNSDVRRLDQLLWYLRELQVFGFQFRQEYAYTSASHRVVAHNRLKTLQSYTHKFPVDYDALQFDLFVAIVVAHIAEFHNGYLFLSLPVEAELDWMFESLRKDHQIRWVSLDSCTDPRHTLYRTESLEDAQRLLKLVEAQLSEIPCARDRFFAPVELATISKELVFDSAHFITDHPGRCVNLHGGRYTVNVKIEGRIDPLTGFVIDYGYLKSVVKERVIKRLDHQNLNYVCSDLGWRSSTELLNIFMWEQLIEYLPGLLELQTYETTQSYCVYRGPTLEQVQKQGISSALKHFSQPDLGQSVLRKLLSSDASQTIKALP
jgi:6-pyruvoyl tetrahydropterin synthase/QueD family protein